MVILIMVKINEYFRDKRLDPKPSDTISSEAPAQTNPGENLPHSLFVI
jgi:hypothetical protein